MARQTKAKRREAKRLELERQRRDQARKKVIRKGLLAVGTAVAVVLLLIAVWPSPSAEEIEAERISNTTADAWDLPQLDGDGRVRLADFRGKPTIAAFFANWCEVCEREIPELPTSGARPGVQKPRAQSVTPTRLTNSNFFFWPV